MLSRKCRGRFHICPGGNGFRPYKNLIYQELKKISKSSYKDNSNQELISLKYNYNKNEKEVENLIQRLKYIDIELIDDVNKEIKKLKEANVKLDEEIRKLETNPKAKELEQKEMAKLVLDILKNYFSSFESFDVIEKRELLKLLIESVVSEDDGIVINLLNSNVGAITSRPRTDAIRPYNKFRIQYVRTATPVLMAAKSHLRNENPLIIGISTNDGLSRKR